MTTEQRRPRLQLLVQASAWWLAFQGVWRLLLGQRLAAWLDLRWQPEMAPYIRSEGLALLTLALFIHRGVEDARRQYLAVDTLLLFLVGRSLVTLGHRVYSGWVTNFEWLTLGVDLLLALGLLVFRTRSKNMQAAGTLMIMDASQLVRQTGAWAVGLGPRPKADLGGLDLPSQQARVVAVAPKPDTLMPDRRKAPMQAAPLPPPDLGPPAPAPAEPPAPDSAAARAAALLLPPDKEEEPLLPRPAKLVPEPPKPAPAEAEKKKDGPTPPPPSPGRPMLSEAMPRLD